MSEYRHPQALRAPRGPSGRHRPAAGGGPGSCRPPCLVVAYYTGDADPDAPSGGSSSPPPGALLVYLAFRLSIYQSLAFFLIVYPYPTVTTVGSTNTLILMVIAIVWAIRAAAGQLKVDFRSLLTPTLPVILLGYLLSSYSIHNELDLQLGAWCSSTRSPP